MNAPTVITVPSSGHLSPVQGAIAPHTPVAEAGRPEQVEVLDRPIQLAWFDHVKDTTPKLRTVSFGELVMQFSEPDTQRGRHTLAEYHVLETTTEKTAEKNGPCFTPAIYKEGGRRCDADLEQITGFCLDFDTGTVTLELIQEKLSDFVYLAHTTYGSQPGKLRWRVFIPYAKPDRPAHHTAVYRHFASLFPGMLDSKCETPSQLWFAPSCPSDAAEHFQSHKNIAGTFFDASDIDTTESSKPGNLAFLQLDFKPRFDLNQDCIEGDRNNRLSEYAWKLLHERTALNELPGLVQDWNRTHSPKPLPDSEVADVVNHAIRSFQNKFPEKWGQVYGNASARPIGPDGKLLPLFDLATARVDFMLDTDPPPPRFILQNCLRLGKTGLIIAPGGTGKSQFAIQLLIAVTTGSRFADAWDIGETGSAIALLAEEDQEEIHRRVRNTVDALAFTHQQREQIKQRLFIRSVTGIDNLMTKKKQGGDLEETDYLNRLIAVTDQISDMKLVILDPLSRFRGGDEIDNNGATRIIEVAEKLAQATGATVLFCHHTNKASGKDTEANQSAARGASALVDGARFVMNLTRMSENDGKNCGIKHDQRAFYIGVAVTKNNYAPPQEGAIWLCRGLGGVLQRAHLLSSAGNAAADQKEVIVKIIRRETDNGEEYSVNRFVANFNGKRGEIGVGDKRLRGLIEELIDEDTLVQRPPKNPKKNVAQVLAIPATAEEYSAASNGN